MTPDQCAVINAVVADGDLAWYLVTYLKKVAGPWTHNELNEMWTRQTSSRVGVAFARTDKQREEVDKRLLAEGWILAGGAFVALQESTDAPA